MLLFLHEHDGLISSVEPIGERTPRRGTRFTRKLGKTLLRWSGWRLEGALPDREKFLAVGAPHTTAWDLGVALMSILALGVRVSWMGADWVFRVPGMRAVGGIPVDRSRRHGAVPREIERFKELATYILGILPEGSRKRVGRWKTGFYHIATGAGVPVLLIAIDHQHKRVRLGPCFEPSGDYEADMETIIRPFYAEYADRYADRFEL